MKRKNRAACEEIADLVVSGELDMHQSEAEAQTAAPVTFRFLKFCQELGVYLGAEGRLFLFGCMCFYFNFSMWICLLWRLLIGAGNNWND